jgi:hypothetical protein
VCRGAHTLKRDHGGAAPRPGRARAQHPLQRDPLRVALHLQCTGDARLRLAARATPTLGLGLLSRGRGLCVDARGGGERGGGGSEVTKQCARGAMQRAPPHSARARAHDRPQRGAAQCAPELRCARCQRAVVFRLAAGAQRVVPLHTLLEVAGERGHCCAMRSICCDAPPPPQRKRFAAQRSARALRRDARCEHPLLTAVRCIGEGALVRRILRRERRRARIRRDCQLYRVAVHPLLQRRHFARTGCLHARKKRERLFAPRSRRAALFFEVRNGFEKVKRSRCWRGARRWSRGRVPSERKN